MAGGSQPPSDGTSHISAKLHLAVPSTVRMIPCGSKCHPHNDIAPLYFHVDSFIQSIIGPFIQPCSGLLIESAHGRTGHLAGSWGAGLSKHECPSPSSPSSCPRTHHIPFGSIFSRGALLAWGSCSPRWACVPLFTNFSPGPLGRNRSQKSLDSPGVKVSMPGFRNPGGLGFSWSQGSE